MHLLIAGFFCLMLLFFCPANVMVSLLTLAVVPMIVIAGLCVWIVALAANQATASAPSGPKK